MRRRSRCLLADRRAVAAVEFAIVGPAFLALVLFLIGAGLVLWARGAIQVAAAETARCTAIGSSDCANPQTYAASVINSWGASGLLPSISVSVQSGVTCNSTAGHFSSVTISETAQGVWAMVPALSQAVLSATACYPSGQ